MPDSYDEDNVNDDIEAIHRVYNLRNIENTTTDFDTAEKHPSIVALAIYISKPYKVDDNPKIDKNIYFLVKELLFEDSVLSSAFSKHMVNGSILESGDRGKQLNEINSAYKALYTNIKDDILNSIDDEYKSQAEDALKYTLDKYNLHKKVQDQFIISYMKKKGITGSSSLKDVTINNYTDSGVNWAEHRKNIEIVSDNLKEILSAAGAIAGIVVGGVVGFGLAGPFGLAGLGVLGGIAGGLVGVVVGKIVGVVGGYLVSGIVGGIQALYNTINYSRNKKSYMKNEKKVETKENKELIDISA